MDRQSLGHQALRKTGRPDKTLEDQAITYGKDAVRSRSARQRRLFGAASAANAAVRLGPREGGSSETQSGCTLVREREQEAQREYKLAARTLEKFLPNDPHEAALHYELADSWFKAGDKAKGQEHTLEALRWMISRESPHKLTDPQRQQLRDWLLAPPTG